MGWKFSFSRDLNIKDKEIQKTFWITDIKELNPKKHIREKDLYDMYDDLYSEPLYSFKQNGSLFEEYIKEKQFAHWNSEFQIIWFKKSDEQKSTRIVNYWQGWECPYCKSWNFEYEKSSLPEKEIKCKCLDCKKESTLEDFERVFN